ncbi:hypothetical protein WJX77_012241 [Trebouxia sp. C0004]
MYHAVLTQQKVIALQQPCLRLLLTLRLHTRQSIEHRDRNCVFSHKSLKDSTSNNSIMSSDHREDFQEAVTAAGQGHLLDDWDRSSTDQRLHLMADIQEFDLAYVNSSYSASKSVAAENKRPPQPLQEVTTLKDLVHDNVNTWTKAGYKLITEGRAAVLLLAGGQGTRLGSSAPKGCYDIGLPSHKSLFQLQAERLIRIQQLAAEAIHGQSAKVRHPVKWYIMTSSSTDAPTKDHFEKHHYFGLDPNQLFFFQQGQLPCLTPEGKFIMASSHALAKAPDGNGGVYLALAKSGALQDMQSHGVEAVDCFAVDNALIKPADPLFLGHCHSQQTDCGARVVAKAHPEEKVGVFARREPHVEVVEYSEMDPQEAASVDPSTGELRYAWSNVCMHYFSTAFLVAMADRLKQQGQYHIAHKNIPSKDGPVQGVKLELFIFDTFPMAQRVSLMEVARASEFAPVKNAPGSASDSPDTARKAIMSLHQRWVEEAGGSVSSLEGIEVSPLMSYGGEGLDQLCKGKTFQSSLDGTLQGRQQ